MTEKRAKTSDSTMDNQTTAIEASSKKTCCVIGGGLAGVAAAVKLAESGVDVTIYEARDYSLGRTAGWDIRNESIAPGGVDVPMQHGYHCVFPTYLNFKDLLKKAAIPLIDENDYMMYKGLHQYPLGHVRGNWIQKIWIMYWMGVFSIWQLNCSIIVFMVNCVFYNEQRVNRRYKDQSFSEFVEKSKFPKLLEQIFRGIARSLFNPPDRVATSRVILSVHLYLFKSREGLKMEAFNDAAGESFVKPFEKLCEKLNVKIVKNTRVTRIEKLEPASGFAITTMENRNAVQFDSVILATDMRTAIDICRDSFKHELFPVELPGAQYLNARIWMEGRVMDPSLPTVFCPFDTEYLDFVFLVHQREKAAIAWAKEGATTESLSDDEGSKRMVLEIHTYFFPSSLNAEEVVSIMLKELNTYVAIDNTYHIEIFHGKDAGHMSHYVHTVPPIGGLFMAGDYTCKTATLMEGAVVSGNDSAAACIEFLK